MIPLTTYAAAIALYFTVGLTAWRVAERQNFEGDNWRLIYRWPIIVVIAAGMLVLLWPAIQEKHT